MKIRILQAYKQAPWRVQIQYIGLFLLGLVLVSAIMGIYLNISAQAATAGRRIQSLESDIDEINDEIISLTSQLAKLTSVDNMEKRAKELGFQQMNFNEAVYLEVPGYDPDPPLILAPPRVNTISESPVIRSSYRSSLWDWFMQRIWHASINPYELEEIEP
jgi:cell division protein FtsL